MMRGSLFETAAAAKPAAGTTAPHHIFIPVDNGIGTVQHQGAIAHQTRLHGAVDGKRHRLARPPALHVVVQRPHFGMIQLVADPTAVDSVTGCNHPTRINQDAAHREITRRQGPARLDQGIVHIVREKAHLIAFKLLNI